MAHSHYWKIGEIVNGVAAGTCKCGAHKSFDAVGDSATLKLLSRVNAAGRVKLGLAAPKKTHQPRKPRAVVAAAPSDGAVSLPVFKDEWHQSVQVKWLEVYAQLHQKQESKEVKSVKDSKVRG